MNGRRIERVTIVPMAGASRTRGRMSPFRSGFVAVVGRPNVGKSTLVNAMVGTKVSIVSPRPNTTRSQVRGVLNRPDAQVVFVDTPGLHKPKTALGERMNESATSSLDDVDAVVALVEATGAVGPGDRMVLAHSVARVRAMARSAALTVELGGGDADAVGRPTLMVVVNKIDRVGGDGVLGHLTGVSEVVAELDAESGGDPVPVEYFPLSAQTGEGVPGLVDALVGCIPEGPQYYPDGMVTDVAEAFWVADLVREELLHRVADELPHSIACRVTEWEWPRVRCEILVERDSQKGIVIGKGGATLKEVGTAVRQQMEPGAYLELFVRVEKRWQQPRGLAGPPRVLTQSACSDSSIRSSSWRASRHRPVVGPVTRRAPTRPGSGPTTFASRSRPIRARVRRQVAAATASVAGSSAPRDAARTVHQLAGRQPRRVVVGPAPSSGRPRLDRCGPARRRAVPPDRSRRARR